MRTGPNFIPNVSGKKGWIFWRDNSWMNSDKLIVPLRKPEEQSRKVKIAERIYHQQLAIEEIINTILVDSTLSQSFGNPEGYPPVPQYTPPEGRRLSEQEAREIKFKIAQSRANAEKRNIVVSENFGDAWVYIVDELAEVSDLERLNETFQKGETKTSGLEIPSLINSDNFLIQINGIEQPNGAIESKGRYSYPEIVKKVSWAVYCCCNNEGTQLLGVVCHRESSAIEEVTAFLADTGMSNIDECNEAILSLSEVHWKLSKLNK